MKDKDNEKKSVRECIRRALEIEDINCGDLLELRGREDLTVSGCKKILAYTESEIRLLLCEYILVIRGTGLSCASYYAGAVRVEGKISSLTLEER